MKNNKLPLYHQLHEKLENKIFSGVWPVNHQIPSERELSEIYDVSRITVRKAIDELVRNGLVEKVHGKGTFVSSNKIQQQLIGIYGYSEQMKKSGRTTTTSVLTKEVKTIPKKISSNLGVDESSKVIYLERVRYDENNIPIILEKTYFPFDKYKFLLEADLSENSLYDLLENDYGIVFDSAIEKYKVCELNDHEIKSLSINGKKCPSFGMLVRRTTLIGNRPETYSIVVTRGDIYEFSVHLKT